MPGKVGATGRSSTDEVPIWGDGGSVSECERLVYSVQGPGEDRRLHLNSSVSRA